LIMDNGGSIDALALTIAAALLYDAPSEAPLISMLKTESVEKVFSQLSSTVPESPLAKVVTHYYRLLETRKNQPLLYVLDKAATPSPKDDCGSQRLPPSGCMMQEIRPVPTE